MTADRLEKAHRHIAELIEAHDVRGVYHRKVVVALVGRGIQSSRTPRMHELEGRRVGLEYIYILIDFDALGLHDQDLAGILTLTQSLGFAGLNVTFPFKQAIVPLLDDLAPEAAGIGAVNTVVFERGRRTGHNTDSWGFAESFREGLLGVDLTSVTQFGAGGAGAAVSHALLSMGARSIILCDTDAHRARLLGSRLSERFDVEVMVDVSPLEAVPRSTGIVNTTPVGMDKFPGTPFDAGMLVPAQWLAEIIYFPPETALLRQARGIGCRTLPGTGMAVYQAVRAFELFTGIAPDRAAMTAHFQIAA